MEINKKLVLFDTAITLRQKGFNVPCANYSLESEQYSYKFPCEGTNDEYWGDNRIKDWNADVIEIQPFKGFISRPEQWMVREWLKLNYGIHINTRHKPFNQTYGYDITGKFDSETNGKLKSYDFSNFEKEEDAIEHAIKYCLENLI